MKAGDFLNVGDVVQIDPAHDPVFAACLLVVTELKPWGVQGYVRIPGSGDAFYRAPFSAIERVGSAIWNRKDEVEEEGE